MTKIRLLPMVVVVLLAACTGGDDTASTTTSTTATTVLQLEVAPPNLTEAYFDSLASGLASERAASPAALPGSAAAVYAEHQATASELLGAASPRTVVARGQGFEVCDSGNVCRTYGGIVIDPATGQVTSFSIDGVPLPGRIVGGGLVADRNGVVARVKSAYVAGADDLFVLVEVDNTTDVPVEMFGFAAVYEPGADIDSIETSAVWGTQLLEPGTASDLLLLFSTTDLGGQLRLSGLRGDGLDITLDIRIPTSD